MQPAFRHRVAKSLIDCAKNDATPRFTEARAQAAHFASDRTPSASCHAPPAVSAARSLQDAASAEPYATTAKTGCARLLVVLPARRRLSQLAMLCKEASAIVARVRHGYTGRRAHRGGVAFDGG